MSFKAVCFDIDGTLYPGWKLRVLSFRSILKNPFFFKAFAGVRMRLRRLPVIEDFAETQASLLGETLKISREEASRLIDRLVHESWALEMSRIPPYPGVKEFILSLRRRGIKTGVLSDLPVEKKLEGFGMKDLFDIRLCSSDSGYLKPDSRAFSSMIDRFGLSPEEILYVGDHYHYDIEGASRVGLKTAHRVWCPFGNSVADFSFRVYADLKKWTERY